MPYSGDVHYFKGKGSMLVKARIYSYMSGWKGVVYKKQSNNKWGTGFFTQGSFLYTDVYNETETMAQMELTEISYKEYSEA